MNPSNTYADIRDIKGLVPLPPGHGWIWWLLAILIIAAAVWFIYRLRRRKQKPPPIPARVRLSPYDLAVQSLQRLLDDKLMERGLVDEFYTRLSAVVRHYLEGRFQLHAPERTTEEFLYEVAQYGGASVPLVAVGQDHASETLAPPFLTQEHKDLLGTFLQECDLVKFARFRPHSADMKRAFDAAEKFVHDTRPRVREEVSAIGK